MSTTAVAAMTADTAVRSPSSTGSSSTNPFDSADAAPSPAAVSSPSQVQPGTEPRPPGGIQISPTSASPLTSPSSSSATSTQQQQQQQQLSPGSSASAALASFYDLPPHTEAAAATSPGPLSSSPSAASASAAAQSPLTSPASASSSSSPAATPGAPATATSPSASPPAAASSTATGDASPPAVTPPSGPAAAGTRPALTAEQQVVRDIMDRFAEWHTDLTRNPSRVLIKEGSLARQATFKTVERVLYLFNDCVVITDAAKGEQAGKLIQKQLLDLRAIVVDDPANPVVSSKKRASASSALTFSVLTPQRDFHFIAPTLQAKAEWMKAIRDAASAHKLSNSSSIVEEGAVEGKVFGLAGDDGYEGRLLTATVHSAVRDGQDDILLHLLSERGEDANAQDPDGNTAVHLAVEHGNTFALSLLIAHGADLSVVDGKGDTVLHIACRRADYGSAMMLVSKGADVKALDAEGRSPLWLLCENVKDAGASADGEGGGGGGGGNNGEEENFHSEKGVVEMVTMMVEAGSDVEESRNGDSLLLHLCRLGRWQSVTALCANNVNVNAIDSIGRSALHIVAQLSSTPSSALLQSYLRIAKQLLSHGAPPNLRDHQLNAPLHLSQSLAMAGCLLVNGARAELRNAQGKKATDWFEQKSSWESESAWLQAKESMRDAQQAWAERGETVLEEGGTLTEEADWIDAGVDVCQLCGVEFTLTRRRHHCRRCGSLVDAQCSSKTFRTPASRDGGLAERCCDCCYNLMVERQVESERRQREARKRDKADSQRRVVEKKEREEADRKEGEDRARRVRESEERTKTVQDRTAVKVAAFEEKKKADRAREAAEKREELQASMLGNRQLLDERGQKLNEMGDKSAQLSDEASNFADMARRLKEREKQRSSWFGF